MRITHGQTKDLSEVSKINMKLFMLLDQATYIISYKMLQLKKLFPLIVVIFLTTAGNQQSLFD